MQFARTRSQMQCCGTWAIDRLKNDQQFFNRRWTGWTQMKNDEKGWAGMARN